MERGLAGRLDALALPAGGLLGPSPARQATRPSRSWPRHRAVGRVFAVLAAGFLGVVAINTIADNTQDRPDPRMSGHTDGTGEVTRRFSTRGIDETAEALFVVCRPTIPHARQMSEPTVEG